MKTTLEAATTTYNLLDGHGTAWPKDMSYPKHFVECPKCGIPRNPGVGVRCQLDDCPKS